MCARTLYIFFLLFPFSLFLDDLYGVVIEISFIQLVFGFVVHICRSLFNTKDSWMHNIILMLCLCNDDDDDRIQWDWIRAKKKFRLKLKSRFSTWTISRVPKICITWNFFSHSLSLSLSFSLFSALGFFVCYCQSVCACCYCCCCCWQSKWIENESGTDWWSDRKI